MKPLPVAPPPDWRQYVLRAIIWVCFVGALGYAAANGGLGFLENDVSVAIEPNRDRVSLVTREPPVIQLKLTLRNNTAKDITLSAGSACKIFRWQIFSQSGELIQSRIQEDACPTTPVSMPLLSGQHIEEIYSVLLEGDRYKQGHDYLLHVWYWGYENEFVFKTE